VTGEQADASIGVGLRNLRRSPKVCRLVLGVAVMDVCWYALIATIPFSRYLAAARQGIAAGHWSC